MRVRVALGCLVLVPLTAWSGAAEAKPVRADLVVKKVAASPVTVTPGGTIRVQVVVRNKGKRAARSTRTQFFLSRDARFQKSKDRVLGASRTKKLTARKKARSAKSLRVPANLAAGPYRVIACADAARRVKESNEKNNCRASKVFNVRAASQPKPVPPAPDPGPIEYAEAPSAEDLERFVDRGDAFWWPTAPVEIGRDETVGLDLDRSVHRKIDHTGGSIEVTSSAGDVFTLSIPAGALTGAVEIAATPLTELGSARSGEGLFGLALEPEGLTFLAPAELGVVPAAGGVGQHAVGFTGAGDGSHTRPAEIDPDPGRLAMPVWHFSNAGVMTGSLEAGFFAPSEFDASPQTEIAETTSDARNDAVDGGDVDRDALADAMADAINARFAELEPKLPRARTDCAYGVEGGVVGELFTHLREWQLVGLDPPAGRESLVASTIRAALQNCVDEMTETCMVMDRDRLARWTTYVRRLALLGEDTPSLDWCHNINGFIETRIHRERLEGSGPGTGSESTRVSFGFSAEGMMYQPFLDDDVWIVGTSGEGRTHFELSGHERSASGGVCSVTSKTTHRGSDDVDKAPPIVLRVTQGTGKVGDQAHRFVEGTKRQWTESCSGNSGTEISDFSFPDMWFVWDTAKIQWSGPGRVAISGRHEWTNHLYQNSQTLTGEVFVLPSQ